VSGLNYCYQKLASTFGAILQRGFPVKNQTLYRHAALSVQLSQNSKLAGKTMEMHSPTINSTTQLDAACHSDSRMVDGETSVGISMYS
jgi:hypothetical protein